MSRAAAGVGGLDLRAPVIAGVGVCTQRVDEPGGGDEAVELMVAAAQRAGDDSGSPALVQAIDRVAVPHGSWHYTDPGRIIARTLGSSAARTVLVQTGIPQQTLLDQAYSAILSGDLDVVLVVGGEAAYRAALARRAGVAVPETDQAGAEPDELQRPTTEIITRVEIEGGIASAMAPFAIIDSALRHAEGRTIDEHRDEIARLWSGFNAVAGQFAHAAFPERRDAAFLREPSSSNRPFAFPYNKWHCAQMNVDQAAAILICSTEAAQRLGVDPDRVVYPLVGLDSSFSVPVSQRRHIQRWPGMEELGRAAERHLGRRLSDVDLVEVYSCFPAAVRVQQRALELPADGVPTITGGESFAGGPWNNFVLQATAAMVERVRDEPDATGLVTTVSGLLNKPGLAVYAATPEVPLLTGDLAADGERATERCEVVADYQGRARVAAYTVAYDGFDPVRTTVIADTPDATRVVATCADAALAETATRDELIGTEIEVDATAFRA